MGMARTASPGRGVSSQGLVTVCCLTASPGEVDRLRSELLETLDGIEHEVMYAYVHKQVYTALRDELLVRRPGADATFLNSYSHLYARGQVMMVRRLADRTRGKPLSLWWVIECIRRNPRIASRAALLASVGELYPDDGFFVAEADRMFSQRFGEDEVPPDEMLASLQERLRAEVETVIEFADRHVAHRDPRGAAQLPTYAEIHAAIDHVAGIVNEVNLMLRNRVVAYEPVTIQGDWQQPFRPALFPLDPSVYCWPDADGFT